MRAKNPKATHAERLAGFEAERTTQVVSVYFRARSPVPQFYPIASTAKAKRSGWGLQALVAAASVLLFAGGMGLVVGIAFELGHDRPESVTAEVEPANPPSVLAAAPAEEPPAASEAPEPLAPGDPRMTWPVESRVITSRFGMRTHPLDEETKFHRGVDILCPVGSPVMAADDGEVARISRSRRGGISMKITHGSSMTTFYEHLTGVMVAPGEKVQSGQLIALSGSTGAVTGPHLHFEVIRNHRARNPLAFEWRPTPAPVTVESGVASRPPQTRSRLGY